jgi:multiple antibiotic resistance protein
MARAVRQDWLPTGRRIAVVPRDRHSSRASHPTVAGVNLQLFGEAFVTLFVIVDPPGMLPIFLALTGALAAADRHRAARVAVVLAFGVITVFAIAGQTLLGYLHIELPALQAAGGLLLVLVSLQLLTGQAEDPNASRTSNVALVPLGTPLLAGPGVIVATILFVRNADRAADYVAIGAAIISVLLIVWLMLRFSGVMVRLLRPAGIEVLTRIAGLLLAAIAVQLMADAVAAFVTDYVRTHS